MASLASLRSSLRLLLLEVIHATYRNVSVETRSLLRASIKNYVAKPAANDVRLPTKILIGEKSWKSRVFPSIDFDVVHPLITSISIMPVTFSILEIKALTIACHLVKQIRGKHINKNVIAY